MSKIRELVNTIMVAKDTIGDANDEIRSIVAPLLKTAGIADITRDSLDSVYFDGNNLEVTVSWSCRGCRSSATHYLPLSILDADDPMQAATKYKETNDESNKANKIKSIRREIARLNSMLNKGS